MPDATIKELLASSSLAFTGTVQAVAATTVRAVQATDRTVIVQVGEVLHGPPEIGALGGTQVTVQLAAELPPLDVGDRATFFTNGWVYGEGMAVIEVGRTSVEEAAERTLRLDGLDGAVSPVHAALAELAQDELVEHARGADAVVRGRIVGLAEVPDPGPPREHDPDPWVATLEVDHVERGELAPGAVPVLYANSIDARWRESPKPKAGQAGLWLLHRTSAEQASVAPFELIHPIDMQPSIQLDVLRERGI